MGKKNQGLFSLLVVLCLTIFLAFPVIAVETKSGNIVYVPSGQITGPLFVSGNMITVDADVKGDVFAAGQSIVINGTVSGDVIAAGYTIDVNGNVLGDIRSAANAITVNGAVGGSITSAGNLMTLKESGIVKRDVVMMGNSVDISGSVGGQVMGSANQLQLNSSVQGDVTIWDVENLIIGPKTMIDGSVTYRSTNEAQITPGVIKGKVQRLQPLPLPDKEVAETAGFSWLFALVMFAAGVLFWATIYLLLPKFLPSIEKTAMRSPLPSLGWGLLTLIVVPIAALLFMITVIGIPLALMLLLLYTVILGSARIIISDILGRLIVTYFKQEGRWPFVLSFMITYGILIFLGKIPILGLFINLIIASIAFGVLILTYYRWRKEESSLNGQIGPVLDPPNE